MGTAKLRNQLPRLLCLRPNSRAEERSPLARGFTKSRRDRDFGRSAAVVLWRKDDRNSQLPQSSRRSSGGPCVRRDVTAHSDRGRRERAATLDATCEAARRRARVRWGGRPPAGSDGAVPGRPCRGGASGHRRAGRPPCASAQLRVDHVPPRRAEGGDPAATRPPLLGVHRRDVRSLGRRRPAGRGCRR